MKTRLQLEFIPPSANHIWRHSNKGGVHRTYATKDYVTWKNAVGHQVNRQKSGQPTWDSPVMLTLAMRQPRANSDCDNRIKPIQDLLQEHGILKNDNLVRAILAYWSDDLPDGIAAEIVITAAEPSRRAA